MFPAYTSTTGSQKSEPNTKSLFPIESPKPASDVVIKTNDEWLSNKSFSKTLEKTNEKEQIQPQVVNDSDSTSSDEPVTKIIKKPKKHKEKKKHKKKKHKHDSSDSESSSKHRTRKKSKKSVDEQKPFSSVQSFEVSLLDKEYKDFFSKCTSDTLKKAIYFEDIPGLMHRNAFKINKKGDKNNLCFDTVYEKYLSKYNAPKEKFSLKEKKISTKKVVRKQIVESKKRRYFVLKSEPVEKKYASEAPIQNTLSNKMWLLLETQKEFEQELEEPILEVGYYMKYLQENPKNIDKWLEFIRSEMADETVGSYERKFSIFEKAIKENPESFRLKIELLKFKIKSYEIVGIKLNDIEADFLSLIFYVEPFKSNKDQLANQFETWIEFIKFLMENNSSYLNFEKIRKVFQRCFVYLLEKEPREANDFFYANILHLLDIYCNFLKKSGYIEKSISLYQAILDFNFSVCENQKSKYANINKESKKTLFELYWDLGLPKFGENYSTGWLNCLETRDSIFEKLDEKGIQIRFDDFLDVIEDKILLQKSIRIEFRWLEMENLRSALNWYPFYPDTINGESADDCIDPDRLIIFDEDLSFFMFDVSATNDTDICEALKFKILCKFFKHLGLFDHEEECLDLVESNYDNPQIRVFSDLKALDEDSEFIRYLNEKFAFFESTKSEEKSFLESSIGNLMNINTVESFEGLKEAEKINTIETLILLNKNIIDFIRKLFEQSLNSFSSLKHKTNVTVLKWKFEIILMNILMNSKQSFLDEKTLNTHADYFCLKTIRENLLAQSKANLGLEINRSNFDLWKQYGILKWVLNHDQYRDKEKKISSQNKNKETRKVFETLLNTSLSSACTTTQHFIDIYGLSVDYALLELGIFYKQFDIISSSLNPYQLDVQISSARFQSGFFDIKMRNLRRKESRSELKAIKAKLCELLIKNCLDKNIEQQLSKSKSTFKIDISGSTRMLLRKRDFQQEYEKQAAELLKISGGNVNPEVVHLAQKKLVYFHQICSLFYLCIDDIDSLVDINDKLLNSLLVTGWQSKLFEFYLCLLNYLYYRDGKITKFMYKVKLFKIIRYFIPKKNTNASLTRSCLRMIQVSLIRLKCDTASLFCNQLIENNEVDILLERIGRSPDNCSTAYISLIHTYVYKLDQVLKLNNIENNENSTNTYSTNLGIHYKIRRLFDDALKINSKSLNLWTLYLKFEINYAKCSNNRILYLYYQSIKSLPYCKTLYEIAVEYLPEKYNEIMTLLYDKEIRVYLPIQELNLLLEPLKHRSEQNESTEEKEEETNISPSNTNESFTGNISSSSSDENSNVNINESRSSDSESDTNSSVENLKDLDY